MYSLPNSLLNQAFPKASSEQSRKRSDGWGKGIWGEGAPSHGFIYCLLLEILATQTTD